MLSYYAQNLFEIATQIAELLANIPYMPFFLTAAEL